MTAPGALFEIKVDGVVRSCRDLRETAIEAAHCLQQWRPRIATSAAFIFTGR
jgi:hypothetical protein